MVELRRSARLRMAERLQRDDWQRYMSLIDISPDAVLIHRHGEIKLVNRIAVDLLGASGPDDLIGKSMYQIIAPESYPLADKRYFQILAGIEYAPPVDQRYRRLDGVTVDVEVASRPTRFQGRWAIQSVVHDLSRRRQAMAALQESEQRYRCIFEENQMVQYLYDPTTGRIVDANPAALAFYGWDRDRLSEITNFSFSKTSEEEIKALMKQRLNGYKGAVEQRHLTTKGVRDVEANSSLVTIGGRSLVHVFIQDVSERKAEEEALRWGEALFRRLAEDSPFAMLIEGPDRNFEYINDRFVELFGYTLDMIPTNREWRDRAYPDPEYRRQVGADLDEWDQKGREQTKMAQRMITCADGQVKEVLWHSLALPDGRVFRIAFDMTDHRRLEDAQREKLRLEGALEVAGAACHELNQPLQAIMGQIDLILMTSRPDDPKRSRMEQLVDQIERMAKITGQLGRITRYKSKDYIAGSKILDLDKSTGPEDY